MKRAFFAVACLFAIVIGWLVFSRSGKITRDMGRAKLPATAIAETGTGPSSPTATPSPSEIASQPSTGADDPNNLGQKVVNSVPAVIAPLRRTIPVTAEFVATLVTGPDAVSFALPDGRTASGSIDQRHMATDGSPAGVSGRLTAPGKGNFLFRVQPDGSPTGPVVGAVAIDNEETAFRVLAGPTDTSLLSELPVDQVICRSYLLPPEEADQPEEIPADHPTSIPIPTYQNGVIPLQSLPGALGVIYLDFDGQTGPQENWGNFDAASPNVSNTTIKDVWTRVCEDYAPFNLNITTDLQVYLTASETSRQRCIVTPTTTAAPGAGGVAWVGSFAWSGDTPCWSFYASGKNSAEIIAHEIGHTLGLSHDGRNSPFEGYYLGHGTDPVGWAPIMGAGYYKNLSQWSKGEYLSANNPQDDVAIIAANNNVGYRTDDAGATHATAALLEIFTGGVVNSQGTIEKQTDVDAFKFTTTGGSVNLAVSPVAAGPDLDILASIYDESGNLAISNNPDAAISATLVATLAAGEYTVRVNGVGRAFPLVDGYTDYGSLGQYTITGTITGAIVPDRFMLAENPSVGAAVGVPTLQNNHTGAPLTYSITAGNTGSAFTIDPNTGAITVATPSVLNYETLSSSWTNPPALNLTIDVVDTLNSALNESLRVVVAISNVNEVPAISEASAITAISHTVNTTPLATITASDPDAFDFPVFSISSGNLAGKFAISQTGVISVAGDLDSTVQSSYSLTIRATDHGTPALTADLPVTVTIIPLAATYTPGFVYHTIYEGIGGSTLSSLTDNSAYPTAPTREVKLTSFTATTEGDNYGSSIRAWLIAPYTGRYEFWIAGDDSADLNFSSAGNPAATTKICYLTSSSNYQEWTAFSSQHSTIINLTAGQICYIEAIHKENSNDDHLSVAWQIEDTPGTTTIVPQEVIPGRYLSPHQLNYSPKVLASTASLYQNSYTGHSVATPIVTDLNPTDGHTWAITGGNSAGIFSINPATGQIGIANAAALAAYGSSSVILTLTSTDNGSAPLAGSGSMTINLVASSVAPTAGLIQEFWDGVIGTDLSNLYAVTRYPNRPDRLVDLTTFDSGSGIGDNYGARIRAYVIPPSTGSYTFCISSDNNGSLLLSTDSNPANATQIASVATFSGYQTWGTYPSQTSAPVTLTAGQRYFIEGRVKESTSSDHLSVAWTGPSIPSITLIDDADTEPYDSNVAPAFGSSSYSFSLPGGYSNNSVAGTVVATDSPFEEIRYAIVSGDPQNGFSINPVSGQITAGDTSNISIGSTYNLQIGAQDSGHGRHFAPRETLVPVAVTVPGTNIPPVFTSDPITLGPFPAGQPLSASIASFAIDPGDVISFDRVSGPSWLTVSTGGLLSGTPDFTQLGPHAVVVSANDGHGHVVQGNVTFTISAPPNGPLATLTAANAIPSLVTGSVLSGTATNASTSDNTYQVLREASSSGTSALDYRWTFATPANTPVNLRVEAHHTSNTEDDDFQFLVSTDGGGNFTDALLVTKTSDDNNAQSFSFTTGAGDTTVIEVIDANRTNGKTALDSISLDLLALDSPGNAVPSANDTTFQVASHTPVGVSIGNVVATDPDADQTLSFSLPRGNEAGYFAISPTGALSVAADIPEGTGPIPLIVVATDDGVPSLANYATVTINVVPPLPATVTLENLAGTYDGNPHAVTVTVDPVGLPYVLTYNGSPTPPIHPGNYAISASVVSSIYAGTATATQIIAKAPASILLENLSHTYDGTPKSATASSAPLNLNVDITYNGSATPPSSGGSYSVVASINDPDFAGSATDTLEIAKAPATVTLEGLSHEYDGSPKPATATTNPPGLDVTFTYNGLADPPADAGVYEVVAAIDSTNYSGSATASLVINSTAATINLADFSQTYDGTPKPVSFTTTPPGVSVEILYDGSLTPPTAAGTYPIVATTADPNFTGGATGSLVIAKAIAMVTLDSLSQAFDGSPKSVTFDTSPANLTVAITYDGSPDAPSAVGSYEVSATVEDDNYFGTASGTLEIRNNLIIAEGQTVDPPDVSATYHALVNDGTLVLRSGTLHIAANAINNGVLRLTGDAVLDISGTFTNTGFIDIINWTGTLPPDLVNTGTIIDRTAVSPLSVQNFTAYFTFSIPGFNGHLYQLESSPALTGPWSPIRNSVPGSGSLAAPPALGFSQPIDGQANFYRVQVTPAP
ncbi:MAG: MBG domain-containing protein [Luteolibacter sp.]|uniref:MBG domain-containing protein n=1 Tax=Luteolibacter sp. TaxID=1962973 RepID=UPI0032666370